jgi:hypothetical protein
VRYRRRGSGFAVVLGLTAVALGTVSSAAPAAASGTSSTLLGRLHTLSGPLGMMSAPNDDLIVVNGNNGDAVEISPSGKQLLVKTLVEKGAGDLFGLTATRTGDASCS